METFRIASVLVLVLAVYAAPVGAAPGLANDAEEANKIVKNPFTFDDIFNSSLSYRTFTVDWLKGQDVYVFEDEDGIYAFDIAANETELLVDRIILNQLNATRYYVSNDLRYVLLAYEVKSIFVTDNNIYYQASPHDSAQQVTTSGKDKILFNGIADWLYEEEILGSHIANWWSEDGQLVCYGMFNDSDVPLFKFHYYGPKTDVYGNIIEIAYPKAGHLTPGENSRGYLYVFNVSQLSGSHVLLRPPSELTHEDHYFTKVSWRDKVTVTVVWSNRAQNRTITTLCNVNNGICTEPDPPVVHIEGGQAYMTVLPRIVLSTGTWSHLAYITSEDNVEATITFLTDGQQEIKTIEGFEAERNLVYYISTDGDPRKRHLFRIGTPAADPAFQSPECLTCDLSPGYDYVSVSFSTSGRYYLLSLRGPEIPNYYLKATQYSFSQLLEDNADVAAKLAEKTLPIKQYLQIPIGGGYTGWAEILIPQEALQPGNNLKFPLLVETYAGPGSQAVDFRFETGFDTYMVSSHNIVYVRIDGRGTTSRGDAFKYLVYRKLATIEIDDQIAGARYLRDNLEYIDARKRPGIWGWSYGGFATAHAVANIANFFQCGMIGAALSDRRYYDSAHTERFMGYATPDDNAAGYDGTDVMRKVKLFTNKTLLIVHGTADDNVHFASSMQLIRSLTEAEIQFRLQVYPDQNHYFSRSSRHLYRLYSDFWLKDCWAFDSQAKQVKVLY
ncbi:hypothetical protein LSH36_251g08017 [Paralvinella palmiformis]|uniref:Venom dipeptidyl peptidase 4 n=1 Tax=Paralvinella palmiformis TaxID=53620 RepID=A0AAD9JLT2_9ANNE|nr:hypothetical protein LSH36_251g08017 [Paralvinella palmiformis]